jgi:quercetin dioxygenase-like cupin family protein
LANVREHKIIAMRRSFVLANALVTLALLILLSATALQAQTAVPVEAEPHHKTLLQNDHVRVFLAEVPPHQETGLHHHERDYLAIELVDGHITNSRVGAVPVQQWFHSGDLHLAKGGFSHVVRNDADTLFRSSDIEFTEPQGDAQPSKQAPSRYCNPGSKTACVTETYVLCTAKVCVSDVTLGEGAKTTRHTHTTDHMLVAVTDYELTDQVEGKGQIVRTQKSGGVEYVPAGITHQLVNTSKGPVRFIVVVFR